VLLLTGAAGLTARNMSAITLANRQPLAQFGELAVNNLPAGGGFVLSDNPEKLEAFQSAQARHADSRAWLAVDVHSLPTPEYREHLERLRPGLWMLSTNQHNLNPMEMMQLTDGLVRSSRVFYLHPSLGYLFEAFYLVPVGSVFELKPFQTNSINPPTLTAESIAQNEKVWDEATRHIESLQHVDGKNGASPVKLLEKKLCLDSIAPETQFVLNEWYSMALNGWGVALQRAGHLTQAQQRFTQALDLNTNNWIARGNLFCCTNLQAGNKMSMVAAGNLASQLGSMQKYGLLLARFGPVDEPALCYILGDAFAQSGQMRQAIQQFERAAALAPEVPAPRLALASIYARCRLDEQALKTIDQLRSEIKKVPEAAKIEARLSMIEAAVCLSQTNLAGARLIYQSLLLQHPNDTGVKNSVLEAYMTMGDFTNAEMVVTSMLNQKPDDIGAMFAKSGILLQTGRAAEAIPILNQILSVTNSIQVKLNRAAAYLQTTNYAAANSEYLELQTMMSNPFYANLGLGELALRQHDTNLAVRYYTLCLSNAPPMSPHWKTVRTRLDALDPGRKG
jgi:tetratricopeptide (TPR) repeat protein